MATRLSTIPEEKPPAHLHMPTQIPHEPLHQEASTEGMEEQRKIRRRTTSSEGSDEGPARVCCRPFGLDDVGLVFILILFTSALENR